MGEQGDRMNTAKEIVHAKETRVLVLKFSSNEIKIRLNNTDTAKKMLEILPVKSRVSTWGDEIYFSIPLDAGLENGREIVDIGTVAFWPPGRALCIFFGPTPASDTDKPRAASPVSVIGGVMDKNDIEHLKNVTGGDTVVVDRIRR